jgi:Fe-S cluster assembly iron-binding protein IscA
VNVLAMTQEAAQAVEAIVDRPDLPDTAVLRITKQPSSANGSAPTLDLQLELVTEPPPDDVVVEDMPISVQPEAASFLEDKVLDAEFEGDGVRFSLYGRPDSAA